MHARNARAILSLLVLAACSDADPAASTAPSVGAGDASAPPDAGALNDAGEPIGEPVVPFSIVDEPAAACDATTTAASAALALPAGLILTDLGTAGSRRVARDVSGKGVVLFDADGSAPVASALTVGDENRAAAGDSDVLVAGVTADLSVVVRRFDLTGAPLGEALTLGKTKIGRTVGIARTGATSIVTWVTPDDAVVARVLDGADLGALVTLESGAASGDVTFAPVVLADGESPLFGVYYALQRVALNEYRVYSGRVGKTGQLGLTRVVFGAPETTRLVGATRRGSGVALLANIDGAPTVVPLDPAGRPVGAAHRFAGARDVTVGGGLGLAVQGEELGLLAAHESGAHALRRLDAKGAPVDGWVCLDAPGDDAQIGGLLAEPGGGWAAVLAAPGDTSKLVRVDGTGRAPR